MPALVVPGPDQHDSFLAAIGDFRAEGRGTDVDHSALGRNIVEYADRWTSTSGFAEYVAALHAEGDPAVPPPAGWVHSSNYWWVEGRDFLGVIRIRHSLTPSLLEEGGHIGYDVAPGARRRGHGTAMLAAALPVAARLGIDSALLTCDVDNVGSRKIIEANGGQLEDERSGKLRYWVPTQ